MAHNDPDSVSEAKAHECEFYDAAGGDRICSTCGRRIEPLAAVPVDQTRPEVGTVASGEPITLAESLDRRDSALALVDEAAPIPWKLSADRAIVEAARTLSDFMADDVWTILDEWGIPPPPEPRALGPRIQAARRAGIVQATGDFRKSVRSHGTPRYVYTAGRRGPQ